MGVNDYSAHTESRKGHFCVSHKLLAPLLQCFPSLRMGGINYMLKTGFTIVLFFSVLGKQHVSTFTTVP